MGWNDNIERWDSTRKTVKCRCGAVYSIYEDDGTPGCRDIETANCEFCGAKLASHFGDCYATLVDDKDVSDALKDARKEFKIAVDNFHKKYGYEFNDEYKEILNKWHSDVEEALKQ